MRNLIITALMAVSLLLTVSASSQEVYTFDSYDPYSVNINQSHRTDGVIINNDYAVDPYAVNVNQNDRTTEYADESGKTHVNINQSH